MQSARFVLNPTLRNPPLHLVVMNWVQAWAAKPALGQTLPVHLRGMTSPLDATGTIVGIAAGSRGTGSRGTPGLDELVDLQSKRQRSPVALLIS